MDLDSINKELKIQKQYLIDRFGISNDREMHKFINKNITDGAINDEVKKVISQWGKYQSLFIKHEVFRELKNGCHYSAEGDVTHKDKVITLFKGFLSNKEHMIHIDDEQFNDNQAKIIDRDITYWRNVKFENEYIIGGDILDDDDKKYYTKGLGRRFLYKGEEIKTIERSVEIRFDNYPNIILMDITKPVEATSGMESGVSWKGIKGLLRDKVNIIFSTYKSERFITLKFGKIEYDLSENEFNELFNFANNLGKLRAIDVSEALLDKRIEQYCKD